MTEEEENKQVVQQKQDLLAIRKELEPICEKQGYSLGQVCNDLIADEHMEKPGGMNWNGLGHPKNWFLNATNLTNDDYWKLAPADRLKKLREFPKR